MRRNGKNNAMEVKKMKFNAKKFSNLVHYICHQCDDVATLGATKLNKILWFSDIYAYLFLGKPSTGEKYIKRQFGPVPSHIVTTIDELVWDEKIFVRDVDYFGRNKREYISLKKPILSDLSPDEISIVNDLIGMIWDNHTAASISPRTHDRIWELAEIGEEIPYYTIFASELGEITEDDIEWANETLKKAA
jgi:hypothetical protein